MAGAITLAAGVGAAFVVPPLLATVGAESVRASTPSEPATPVISASPVPEPTRAPVDWDSFSEEQARELSDRQTPQNIAISEVRDAFPDDYAYGFITDSGFGMSFKAEAPPEALAILDAVGDPYELHENVGFTELDMEPQLSRTVALVQKAVGKQGMSAGANVFTVTFEVQLYPDSGDQDDSIVLDQAELELLEDSIRPELYPGFDIEVTSVPGVEIGW
ncbi:hypothetical protein E3O42_12220 [Cryobacterium adonitolivorans]|uniref:Uncharacterized protein n=1 Tax=Cryobacterium adonitolivorans TaxID=1259189 RepID=A0A4R8W4L6_9MICO|nr:hypothetical protein [Cryobacterium adonitolivorans]TFC00667.1 hypothetical protein E3O42_12220 [Cryobacterium adonitolivorans]